MSSLQAPTIDESVFAPSDDVIHNGYAWASAAEDNAWAPAILTLDGGGIRGYSSLLILKALMHEIAIWERRLEREEGPVVDDTEARKETLYDEGVAMPRGDGEGGPMTRDGGRKSKLSTGAARGAVEIVRNCLIIGPKPPENMQYSHKFAEAPNEVVDGPAEVLDAPSAAMKAANVLLTEGLTEYEDNLLPCHYFDYMYGTSTGGLIATMLGRLRMSVPQCLEIYREVSDSLFGKQRSRIPLATKYYHKPLEEAVKEIVRQYCKQHPHDSTPSACNGEDWHPWDKALPQHHPDSPDFNNHICQSICLTASHNGKIDEAHLLRTYNQSYVDIPNWATTYNEGADNLRIWEVTRATSAAPFYFKSLVADIGGRKWVFKDGGIRENNPAGAAWSEYVSMYGGLTDPALLLSVGTGGRPAEDKDGFAAAWPGPLGNSKMVKKMAEKFAVLKNALVKYTAGEEKHKHMLATARGEHKWYKRLNVSSGLEAMPLDCWKKGEWTDLVTGITSVVPGGETVTEIEKVTKHYLAREIDMRFDTYAPPKTMLVQVAEKLVRQRRAREKSKGSDRKRWDTYVGKYLTGVYEEKIDGPLVTKKMDV